jgi:hypothetical protein
LYNDYVGLVTNLATGQFAFIDRNKVKY